LGYEEEATAAVSVAAGVREGDPEASEEAFHSPSRYHQVLRRHYEDRA